MAFFVDENKTGPENFIDLVIHSNPNSLYTPGRVGLSAPVRSEIDGLTRVTVSAIPGEGYTVPNVQVEYQRQSPVYASGTQLKGDIQLEDREYTQQELKDLIIGYFKLVSGDVNVMGFGEGDEILIPTSWNDPSENLGYRITSKSDSYIYEDVDHPYFDGGFIGIYVEIPLSELIPNNTLTGFTSI